MLREELWVRRVRLEGSSAAPVRGAFAVDGNAPLCQCRAVRSLIPAAAAAAANVFPDIRFSRNRRTWASVINPSSTRKTGSLTRLSVGPRTGRSRPRQPARIIVVDHRGIVVLVIVSIGAIACAVPSRLPTAPAIPLQRFPQMVHKGSLNTLFQGVKTVHPPLDNRRRGGNAGQKS